MKGLAREGERVYQAGPPPFRPGLCIIMSGHTMPSSYKVNTTINGMKVMVC